MLKLARPLLATALLVPVSFIAGCQTPNATPETAASAPAPNVKRDVAAEPDEDAAEFEPRFQALLNEPELPVKLKYTYLERLLRIYYKAELLVEDFERNLDDILAKKKKNPSYDADPLEHVSYQRLIGEWMLSQRLVDEVAYNYRRLLETTKSESVTPDQRTRAVKALNDLNDWIAELPEEDKLQMVEMFQRLDKVKKSFDTAAAATGDLDRSVAAVSDISIWAHMEPAELQRRHKIHRKQTRKKALESKAVHDDEADADFAWLKPERQDRFPSAAKIYPSPGPDGNVVGKVFPAGTFVLTFDDGPGAASTQRLLPILKSHNAPATFFQLAKQVVALPKVVDTMKSQFGGHLNDHSWTHANFAKCSQAQLNHEIVDSASTLKQAYGRSFRFFRCPYGACFAPKIPVVREMIANLGLIHAYWAIDSLDWKNIGQPQRTLELIKKQMAATGRGIILMHDIHESSVDAANLLLDYVAQSNASGRKIRLLDLESAVDEVNQ